MNAMAEQHYSKAPITEALIDLRVELAPEVSLQDLAKVQAGEEDTYPKRTDQLVAEGQISLGAQVSAAVRQKVAGYFFWSGDGKQLFQARLDGFTFNRLAPYDRWESFRDEARRLWNIYRSVACPLLVTRIAVRYINRLDLPLPILDFGHYLRTVPQVSPDLPQTLSGYVLRLEIPQENIGATLMLTEMLVPPPSPGVASVILDIDIFRQFEQPTEENEIWSYFEQLRLKKNEVFEACITDRTREVIS